MHRSTAKCQQLDWAEFYLKQKANYGGIGDMLSGLMFEAGTSSGMSLNFDSVNEDAAKILN